MKFLAPVSESEYTWPIENPGQKYKQLWMSILNSMSSLLSYWKTNPHQVDIWWYDGKLDIIFFYYDQIYWNLLS